jgi:hypothetical protein
MSARILTRIATYTAAGLLGAGLVVAAGAGRVDGRPSGELTYSAETELAAEVDALAAEDPQPDAGSTTKPDRRERARKLAGRLGHGKRFGAPGRVLHGEFVVRTKDGFKTAFVHRGEVTAVNSTSITVKSADGFTKTYAVTGETKVRSRGQQGVIGDVKVGELAVVGGLRDGDAYTARFIGHRPAKAADKGGSSD